MNQEQRLLAEFEVLQMELQEALNDDAQEEVERLLKMREELLENLRLGERALAAEERRLLAGALSRAVRREEELRSTLSRRLELLTRRMSNLQRCWETLRKYGKRPRPRPRFLDKRVD